MQDPEAVWEDTGLPMRAGAPLPGVTITISSPSLQGTRSTVTGEAGAYDFASLPPGVYSVSFDLPGIAQKPGR